ncbi:MAG: TerB family tellurite resistance protein [Deltaproteobacteria bacterium]|nr:TerB family tellurite resistance protein [Deltaproteobacteria bacterium]
MNVDYASIAPLVSSSEQKGTVMMVVFQDAAGGDPVQASAPLQRGKDLAGATRATAQRKLLSHLGFAISRAVNSALGDVNILSKMAGSQARSAVQSLSSAIDSKYSDKEKQAAILQAFRSVADRFSWDGDAWVLSSAAAVPQGPFHEQLDSAPIHQRADLGVLARMLVELAGADGDVGEDEREFLGTFLPPDMGVDALIDGPALSDADLRSVSEGAVRESMLMLAWGLAFCDDELAKEEQETCRRFARGLGVSVARGKAMRNAAAGFVLEHGFAEAWSGGVADEALREEALSAADRLGLPRPVAQRIESQYKRRHGIS